MPPNLYRTYVEAGRVSTLAAVCRPFSAPPAFAQRIRARHADDLSAPQKPPEARAIGEDIAMGEVMAEVTAQFGVEAGELLHGRRGGHSTPQSGEHGAVPLAPGAHADPDGQDARPDQRDERLARRPADSEAAQPRRDPRQWLDRATDQIRRASRLETF